MALRRRLGANAAALRCYRRLLVLAFLLLSASDARRAVAERSHPYRRVEIRVEDFSFSDGPDEKPQIAIDSHDIKGSELNPWTDGDIHFVTWETSEISPEPTQEDKKTQKQEKPHIATARPATEAETPTLNQEISTLNQEISTLNQEIPTPDEVPAKSSVSNSKEEKPLKRSVSYRTAMWWWSQDKTELTSQEQAAVLAVVVTMLALLGLSLALVWNLGWYVWRFYRERRTLNRLFAGNDAAILEEELRKFPSELLSLQIKQVACVRLRHLQVVVSATDFTQQLESVKFQEVEMELVSLPIHPTSRKEMTFAEILTTVEEIACRGEQVAVEMMQLAVPPRWSSYVDQGAWLTTQDESLQNLHAENTRVQQLSTRISELLMTRLNADEAIPKPLFLSLLASLRQNSGSPPLNGNGNENATPSELDAYARCWSGSMSMSDSVGALGGNKSKDEFSFFLKAFDEVSEQQKVRQELQSAIDNFQAAHEPEHEQLLLLESSEGASTSQIIQRKKQLGTTTGANSGATSASMRRLERWVDQAEIMEMTYVEEVESAQFMLEDARRDTFCAAIVNNEGKGLDNVQALATNFVALGAKREDAILKAGEILANRSNMMLLVTSLRGMFDELRKRDIMKMTERRNRDRSKALEKRERMAQKFQNKQQLIAEKIERNREAQRQQEEEARLQRRQQELKEWRTQTARERSKFVWTVTKVDVLVVLVIMAIVFFENLRDVAFVKPLCQPEEGHHWWMVSWWTPSSLQVFGCEVAYGMKILGILLVLGVLFFVVAQLNLVAVTLPVLGAALLYYVRAEWMNMFFRLPLLLVIYGFNSAVLYLFGHLENRSGDAHVVKDKSSDDVNTVSKQRNVLLYVVFPLLSLLLTIVTGVTIACDSPEHCAASAYAASKPVLAGLWELARDAYRL
ncbi:hypothetical protein PHYBOEH_000804 [Phytophthora boehmeriae]|uniref:Transmembrane protein n=1 Tax=Phytophthora boehmeriae TaxID=109152 RepID=A0A8T1WVB7_9STRA|nr:hypothetical protein PHYBOEH_000804 [Phytophthora boehmeriae]